MEASQQGHVHCEVMLQEQESYPYTVHNMALEAYLENQNSPQKISCFVWLVRMKAFLTHDVLQKRGDKFAQGVLCVHCMHN